MQDEKYKKHLIELISVIKEQAKQAKIRVDNTKEEFSDYAKGLIMGYYSIITLLKHQAFALCLDQKELGLAEISPDADLLGLGRNPDVDYGEDNWAIDVINEQAVKWYLSDTIILLKEQALEAKKEADQPKAGDEDYTKGELMAYYSVFKTLKNQVPFLNIKQEDIGLAGIDPDKDLLQSLKAS